MQKILVLLSEEKASESKGLIEANLVGSPFNVDYLFVEEVSGLHENAWKQYFLILDLFGESFCKPHFELVARQPNLPPRLAICHLPLSREYQEWLQVHTCEVMLNPFSPLELKHKVEKFTRFVPKGFTSQMKDKIALKKIIGQDLDFRREIEKIPLLASSHAPVIIEGETGTGKEICARSIHNLSSRWEKPFVAINCGAIPLELIENELFGHQKEAYTSASSERKGLVQEAHGGTLFFDEIDALPLVAQSKLLRLIQEKEFRPLGSSKTVKADVRIISATNQNLEKLSEDEKFRADLFYRLNVLKLSLPPLRKRQEDIHLLFRVFLNKHRTHHLAENPLISLSTLNILLEYDWPGNVRELENAAERALVYSQGGPIEPRHLKLPNNKAKNAVLKSFKEEKELVVKSFERKYIIKLLSIHNGNISRAARTAGKNRRAFWELMRKHKIESSI